MLFKVSLQTLPLLLANKNPLSISKKKEIDLVSLHEYSLLIKKKRSFLHLLVKLPYHEKQKISTIPSIKQIQKRTFIKRLNEILFRNYNVLSNFLFLGLKF